MSKKENRSITYIYDEMDPSEKVEFERNLETDENLLIEVELFKRITNRLESLNTIEPPKEVLATILNQAHLKNKQPQFFRWNRPVYTAVAALIILSLTSGFLLLAGDESDQAESNTNTATISTPLILQQTIQTVSSTPGVNKITPWVDNNEVIHFQDRLQSDGTAPIDSIFKNSFRKLTPVTNPSYSNPNQRSLHLTGSRR